MLFWVIAMFAVYTWRSWWAAPVIALAGAVFSIALTFFLSSGDLNGIAVAGPEIGRVALAAALEWGVWALVALAVLVVLKWRDSRKGSDAFRR